MMNAESMYIAELEAEIKALKEERELFYQHRELERYLLLNTLETAHPVIREIPMNDDVTEASAHLVAHLGRFKHNGVTWYSMMFDVAGDKGLRLHWIMGHGIAAGDLDLLMDEAMKR